MRDNALMWSSVEMGTPRRVPSHRKHRRLEKLAAQIPRVRRKLLGAVRNRKAQDTRRRTCAIDRDEKRTQEPNASTKDGAIRLAHDHFSRLAGDPRADGPRRHDMLR